MMNVCTMPGWKSWSLVCVTLSLFTGCLFLTTSSVFAEDSTWQVPGEELKKANPIRYDVESVGLGKALFTEHCQACHGYWGEGDGIIGLGLNGKPANLLQIAGKQSTGAFAWKIAEGRNNMPAFRARLTEKEIWHIVNFIESLENELGAAEQPLVIQRCAICHGLAGKAIYEYWPDLPGMTQQEIENKLFGHRSGAIKDSAMSKVTFDLTDEEIKVAAEYYFSLKDLYHTSSPE